MRFVKWNMQRIKDMLARGGGRYHFNFWGIRIWSGIYIGIIDARLIPEKDWPIWKRNYR